MTVGSDQFRIRFGYWIERVAAGEEAVVTRRGKPIIRLTAVAGASAASAPSTSAVAPAAAPAAAAAAARLPGTATVAPLFPPAASDESA
ncbi:MAG: type II toxin-antitoxin system prevent-host-death family antitoxin [Solirubrobacterales bacterium]|nr:type II toxin-antitoxin system prevent-host-death family antitoxin [Solirubrobacterales bacterium]